MGPDRPINQPNVLNSSIKNTDLSTHTKMETSSHLRRFRVLLGAQCTLAFFYFLISLAGFIRRSQGQGEAFSQVALREYLSTIIIFQAKMVPAYLILALGYSALIYPWVYRHRALSSSASNDRIARSLKGLGGLLIADLILYLLSLGPFLSHAPGLLDGIARKVSIIAPDLDYYALYRWHILDGLTLLFGGVCVYAGLFYGLRWARWIRSARGWTRALRVTPPLILLGALTLSVRPPTHVPYPEEAPPNVLIIAADSLRYDHLGVHGYHREDISPHIDQFARSAADLRNLHVSTASTLESWVSFMLSEFPPNHGARYMYLDQARARQISARPETLPRLLNARGYRTSVVSNWAGNCFKLVDLGFEHTLTSDTQNFKSLIMEATIWAHSIFPLYFSNTLGVWLVPEATRVTQYIRPSALTERMIDEIDAAQSTQAPFFGVVFYSTTHLPYSASYPYNVKYIDPTYRGPHRYQIDVSVHDLITTGFSPTLAPETIQQIRDLYDGAVSEFDHNVGILLKALEDRGLSDRTIVLITSDHGEDLYDEGSTLGHGTNFFGGDQSTQIPVLIRAPRGTRPGTQIDALTRHIDLAPTLLSLLDIPPPKSWSGVDLTPLLTGAQDDLELVVFGETCYLFFPKRKALVALTSEELEGLLDSEGASETLEIDPSFDDNLVLRSELHDQVIATKDRMVRTRRWKLIYIPGKETPILRLYDLRSDPKQKRDLSAGGAHPMIPPLTRLLEKYWRGEARSARWPIDHEDP